MNDKNGEFKGTIKTEVKNLTGRIETLETKVDELPEKVGKMIKDSHREIMGKLDDHAEYHKHNEHRWGIPKILRQHVFKVITVTAILTAGVITFVYTGKFSQWIAKYIQGILR